MPPIEKRHYHDEVFLRTAAYVREAVGNDPRVENLIFVLEEAGNSIGDSEKNMIIALNDHNNDLAFEAIADLLRRLSLLFSRNDNGSTITQFIKTFDCYISIVSKYWYEELDAPRYYDIEHEERNNLRNQSLTVLQYEFYRLVRGLIADVNNKEYAWRIVGDYYKERCGVVEYDDYVVVGDSLPITFLSYAFTDRAYAFFLFVYFLDRHSFLYVDFLFSDNLHNGCLIKNNLNNWIVASKNFLFLRSTKSDPRGIRQWCSWEIGRAYHNVDGCYLVDIIGVSRQNALIDDFAEFNDVYNGNIW